MANRGRLGAEREKGVYTKRFEGRDNLITPWYTSSRI